jgi:hypothetical protein
LKQKTSERIDEAIHAWRDADSRWFAETPFNDVELPSIKTSHIGLRIVQAVGIRKNLLMTLNDVLMKISTVAYENSDTIDYIEIVRVRADKPEEQTIAVEVLELSDKRQLWVNQ